QRAWSYLQVGKAAEGLPDADRALALDQNDAASYATRGLIYQALGRASESITDLRKALSLNPSNQAVSDELGKIEQLQIALRKPGTQPPAVADSPRSSQN